MLKFPQEAPAVQKKVEWLKICRAHQEVFDKLVAKSANIPSDKNGSIDAVIPSSNLENCHTTPYEGRVDL
jgi:hypothetical protein